MVARNSRGVALASVVLLIGACAGGQAVIQSNPAKGPVAPQGSARRLDGGGKGGIRDWSVAETSTVAVPRLDQVMAKIDEKLEKARYGRIRSRYGRGQAVRTKSEAPYFFVEGEGDGEKLPLESTSARVSVAGVIAQVLVKQVYRNRGDAPIEAVYRFPASTRAAVHGMRLRIGKRVIVAKIDERKKARRTYETAKDEGKRTSLLTMERDNVLTMRVANIMPNDRIEVELMYSELLVPEDGVYSFVYPAVVGPRNPMGAEPHESTDWVANPHMKAGQKAPYKFDVNVHLATPIALKDVASPSHKIAVSYASKKSADIQLKGKNPGNRDYVLKYRLAGDKIETGAMVYDHGGEKLFLAMVEPPKRVETKQIPGREYVFVLDVSGSMHGFPLNTAKDLMKKLLGKLRQSDRFNVVVFAGTAGVLAPESLKATPRNIQHAISEMGRLRGSGGTNLMDGLRTAYALPPYKDGALSRSVVMVTDGYVSVEAQSFRFIRQHLNEANVFSFGIGSSVNRALIEGVARAGRGEPFIVLDKSQGPAVAEKLRKYIQSPVLTNVGVSYQGVKVYDVVPNRLPDLMARRPLVFFGKIDGKGAGKVTVTGRTGTGKFSKTLPLDTSVTSRQHRPIRVLWAREWARELMDQHAMLGGDEQIQQAVTKLGLGYNLLTKFTSFVAVDKVVVNQGGQGKTVTQALPMPAGVSNRAVGDKEAAEKTAAPPPPMAAQAAAPHPAPRPSPSPRRRYRKSKRKPRTALRSPFSLGSGSSAGYGYGGGGVGRTARSEDRDDAARPSVTRVRKVEGIVSRHDSWARTLVLRTLTPCLQKASGRLEFQLSIAKSGRVKVLGLSDSGANRCLATERMKKLLDALGQRALREGWFATGSSRLLFTVER